jgi:hypothetical protein
LRDAQMAAVRRLNDQSVERGIKVRALEQVAFVVAELNDRGRKTWTKENLWGQMVYEKWKLLILGTPPVN